MRPRANPSVDWLYFCLAAAQVVPIVAFRYVPAVDLPNHALSSLLHTLPEGDPRMLYFKAHWFCSPYVLFDLIASPLTRLLGPLGAVKAIMAACVIAIPISARYFMKTFDPENWEWAFGSFFFVFTFHLEYGFLPYVIGIPLVLVGLALLRRLLVGQFSWPLALITSIVATLVYLSHVINIIALGVGGLALVIWSGRNPRADMEAPWAPALHRAFRLAFVLAAPTLCLLALLAQLPHALSLVGRALSEMQYRSVFHQLQGPFRAFYSVNLRLDLALFGAISLLVLVLLLTKSSRLRRGAPLAMGVAILIISLLMPRVQFLGGTDLSSRLAVFGWFALLASLTWEREFARVAFIIAVCIAVLANLTLWMQYYGRTSRLTEQYVQALMTHIPPQQKVLTTYCGFPSAPIKPLLHAISWYHVEMGGISPFLLFGNVAVNGIEPRVLAPGVSEEWVSQDSTRLDEVLPFYNYFVATTCGSPLPRSLESLPDTLIYRDSVCTIWRISQGKP